MVTSLNWIKWKSIWHNQVRQANVTLNVTLAMFVKRITDSRFYDQFMVPGRFLKSAFNTPRVCFWAWKWWQSTLIYFINTPEQVLEF